MNRLVKNFLYQSSYQVLSIILPIITVPIVNKALGVEGIGLFNYITSITNYFVLVAGLGLAQYGIKEIAVARRSKEELSQKFWELQYFNLIISGIVVIMYIILSLMTNYPILFLINSALVFGTMFDISWFFAGIEDFKKIAIRNVVIKLVSFICIVLFINDREDLVYYFFIQAGSALMSQLSFWFLIKGKVNFLIPTIDSMFSHFKPALTFFLSKISSTIINNSTKTLLGLWVSNAAVGIFSNATLLTWVASTLISSINTVLLPRMSSIAVNEKKKLSDILNNSVTVQVVLTIPLAMGIIVITPQMINWFYGKEFASITSIIPILAISMVFQQVHQAIGVGYNIPMNRMKQYNSRWVIACFVLIILNLILIPLLGVLGASYAFAGTQIYLALARIIDMNKEIKFKPRKRVILNSFLASLIMVGAIRITTYGLSSGLVTTIIQVIIGITIYLICSIVLKQHIYLNELRGNK